MGNSNNHQTSSAPDLKPDALNICRDDQHHLDDGCNQTGGFGTGVCAMGAGKARYGEYRMYQKDRAIDSFHSYHSQHPRDLGCFCMTAANVDRRNEMSVSHHGQMRGQGWDPALDQNGVLSIANPREIIARQQLGADEALQIQNTTKPTGQFRGQKSSPFGF